MLTTPVHDELLPEKRREDDWYFAEIIFFENMCNIVSYTLVMM